MPGKTSLQSRRRHQEKARRRYHEDPEYRAHILALNKAARARAKARGYKEKRYPPKPTEQSRARQRGHSARWKKQHPEAVRTMRLKRRAWEKGAQTTEQVSKDYIYERDRGICHLCGKRVDRTRMTFDHLIPLSLGGKHTADNIALAHRVCNSRRGAGRLPAQLRLLG